MVKVSDVPAVTAAATSAPAVAVHTAALATTVGIVIVPDALSREMVHVIKPDPERIVAV